MPPANTPGSFDARSMGSTRPKQRGVFGGIGSTVAVLCGVLCGLGIVGCGSEQEAAPDNPLIAQGFPPYTDEAHPFAHVLEGRVIGLDPGHGGLKQDDGWGFEGPVNLEVALELKRLLERCGARVVMSRMTDIDVALPKRPQSLEESGAELFISIHHNALKESESNYTSTWYHGFPPKEPASLDLARCLQRRVRDALRTPHKVPVPVMTDRLLYKSGLRVLREAHVPAVLCEASFYTEASENARLQNPEYLKREAYGFYLGLVDYFSQGTPTARLLLGASDPDSRPTRWVVSLDDGLQTFGGWGSEHPRILPDTITLHYNGEPVSFEYDKARARLQFSLDRVSRSKILELRFQNIYKQSCYPTRYHLESDGGGRWQLAASKGSTS